MWAVSDRFLTALGKPHRRVTVATITPYGGEPVTLRVSAGRVQVTHDRAIRRQVRARLLGGAEVFAQVAADGAALNIEHGIRYGNTTELVPVFAGEVVDTRRPFGDVAFDLTAHDYGHWLTEARLLAPYAPTGSPTRAAAIEALVFGGKPDTSVVTTAVDASTVGDAVWDRSRTEAIADLARDGNLEAFYLPDGSFLIRDAKTITSPADYTVRGGPGGTLTEGERARPLERRYNAVVVSPSGTGQAWEPQVAQVTDTSSPRHPDRIGVRPYYVSLPTITTASAALAVAERILGRLVGMSEALAFGAVSNPALEAGDIVRVVVPAVGREPDRIFQHFVQSLALDLVTGAMTAETRSQRSTDE